MGPLNTMGPGVMVPPAPPPLVGPAGVWLVFAIVFLWRGISEAFSVKLIEK